jgi:four helix bundle protein
MEKINNFKQLKIWQKGIEIVKDIYSITEKFPNKETRGLISQMRRASVSIPSNIAEVLRDITIKNISNFCLLL